MTAPRVASRVGRRRASRPPPSRARRASASRNLFFRVSRHREKEIARPRRAGERPRARASPSIVPNRPLTVVRSHPFHRSRRWLSSTAGATSSAASPPSSRSSSSRGSTSSSSARRGSSSPAASSARSQKYDLLQAPPHEHQAERTAPSTTRRPSRMLWRTVRGMVPHKTKRGAAAFERFKSVRGHSPAVRHGASAPSSPRRSRCSASPPGTSTASSATCPTSVGWKHQAVGEASLEAKRQEAKASEYWAAKKAANAKFAAAKEAGERAARRPRPAHRRHRVLTACRSSLPIALGKTRGLRFVIVTLRREWYDDTLDTRAFLALSPRLEVQRLCRSRRPINSMTRVGRDYNPRRERTITPRDRNANSRRSSFLATVLVTL